MSPAPISVLDETSSFHAVEMPPARTFHPLLAWPVPGVFARPPRGDSFAESLSMWPAVAAAMSRRLRHSAVNEVMFPRTLPVTTMDDLAPYHFVEVGDKIEMRKGATPSAVAAAAAEHADGKITLNQFLDRIGVPKA